MCDAIACVVIWASCQVRGCKLDSLVVDAQVDLSSLQIVFGSLIARSNAYVQQISSNVFSFLIQLKFDRRSLEQCIVCTTGAFHDYR